MNTIWFDKEGKPLHDYALIEQLLTSISYKKVAYDEVDNYRISTVWLGLDHSFSSFKTGEKPVIFETMIFPRRAWTDLYCRRYSTLEEAAQGHLETVKAVREGTLPEPAVVEQRLMLMPNAGEVADAESSHET